MDDKLTVKKEIIKFLSEVKDKLIKKLKKVILTMESQIF